MIIKLLVEGGGMKPGAALSQKLGPLGININEVIKKVNESTENFKGMKVPVELDVDPTTKEMSTKVFSPPVSELLKKELGVEKASGRQKVVLLGNLSFEQIVGVSKTKLPNLLCKDLKSAVKTVVGSCVSLGILIDNKPAVEIEKDIDEGKYDKEIDGEITEPSSEKKKELEEHFEKIKIEQDQLLKLEADQKAAEEEKVAKA